MLNFEKPVYKITDYIENNNYGRFELEPLERGFGTTIGNSLRRVMLSSMPGSAIIAVKIDGVMHEFQTLEGVVEDGTTIVLNLKGVVLRNHSTEIKVARLSASKEGVVTAGDIEVDSDIEIINKDHVVATLAKGGKLDMEMIIANGRGYLPASETKSLLENVKVGFIPMDALYSPIERISYEVENARVGQDANYDKLILNVLY
jgi:DNA-directed RNA polymerase subunit alpha